MTLDTLTLQGKVAIVTGSGRENGIGAGIALALARNGASVVVNHVSDSTAKRAQIVATKLREAGGQAIIVQAGVDTPEGAKKVVQATLDGFKTDHIDILVNNAGSGGLVDIFGDLDPQDLNQVYQTNVNGPLYMINAVVPHMPTGGRIVNVSSTQAQRGHNMLLSYAASKAALDNLTWSLAGVLGRSKGITVNSVLPGPVLTDIVPPQYAEQFMQPEIDITRAADRAGTLEDIGDAVLLLVNEKARWITGQNIGVSGGVTR
ncbi:hypothetical protein LMH87_000021 [Akanthomyces muscarius]|uniref:Uncharacterized protein n=1 Tax=Akanthomyces muscarius TaxID=2231603 RepID=A0A9W8QFY9_AKAMU|nr:hypothetical protein LMH87_000021 [Akanthomyces muscarius]KAJ4154742.1 hypothetical protein LMH87_000021 [Akanthomyces muscarius]